MIDYIPPPFWRPGRKCLQPIHQGPEVRRKVLDVQALLVVVLPSRPDRQSHHLSKPISQIACTPKEPEQSQHESLQFVAFWVPICWAFISWETFLRRMHRRKMQYEKLWDTEACKTSTSITRLRRVLSCLINSKQPPASTRSCAAVIIVAVVVIVAAGVAIVVVGLGTRPARIGRTIRLLLF